MNHTLRILPAALLAMILAGCGQSTVAPSTAPAPAVATAATTMHTHEGWWCNEHGVPEADCGLCDPKLAATMQKKGDWCKEHDRPESQCFLCHPEQEARFAARDVARFGTQPPKPQ